MCYGLDILKGIPHDHLCHIMAWCTLRYCDVSWFDEQHIIYNTAFCTPSRQVWLILRLIRYQPVYLEAIMLYPVLIAGISDRALLFSQPP